MVTNPDAVEERRDWSSSGPLTRLGPLYGWGSSSPSLPGEGPQSWLFCPLISLGLLVVEARRAVPAYSTGPRAPVPDSQAQFWTSRARDVIHAFVDLFSSLASDNPLAVTLSSQVSWGPSGDHLEVCIQEALTLPHITSMLEVWLTSQAVSFEGDAEQSRQSRHASTMWLSQTLLSRQLHLLKFVVQLETAHHPSQELALFVSHASWRCRPTCIAPQ